MTWIEVNFAAQVGVASDGAISWCVCSLSMLATVKGWRHGPGTRFNALKTNAGFDSWPCVRTAKWAAAPRPKVKDPVCAVQLTPGRNQVGTLKGPRSGASASRNILRMFRNLDSRPRNRAGRVTRSVGHAHTMVHVRGRLGVDAPAGPAQLGSKPITRISRFHAQVNGLNHEKETRAAASRI
jgi:hypothetical protein